MTDNILKALARGEVPVALVEEELRGTADMSDDRVEKISKAIRNYCASISAPIHHSVGDDVERIYYSGLPVAELAKAITAALYQEERGDD